MTYEELVKKLKSNFEGMDAGKIKEHLAIQFNVAGEAEGALYMEIKDGRVFIEPYEYYDRDILVFVETDALLAIADGELTIYDAFKEGRFYAEGNLCKAELLDSLSKKAAARKVAEKEAVAAKEEAVEKPLENAVEEKEEEKEEEVQDENTTGNEVSDSAIEESEKAQDVEKVVSAPVEKKATGRKVPSRKLKKAAAKKNAQKNAPKK